MSVLKIPFLHDCFKPYTPPYRPFFWDLVSDPEIQFSLSTSWCTELCRIVKYTDVYSRHWEVHENVISTSDHGCSWCIMMWGLHGFPCLQVNILWNGVTPVLLILHHPRPQRPCDKPWRWVQIVPSIWRRAAGTLTWKQIAASSEWSNGAWDHPYLFIYTYIYIYNIIHIYIYKIL